MLEGWGLFKGNEEGGVMVYQRWEGVVKGIWGATPGGGVLSYRRAFGFKL